MKNAPTVLPRIDIDDVMIKMPQLRERCMRRTSILRGGLRAAVAALGAAAMLALPARADELPDFKGKTITLVASFEAGGPYDFYTRLVARYIGAHLPGSPNVIVQNM